MIVKPTQSLSYPLIRNLLYLPPYVPLLGFFYSVRFPKTLNTDRLEGSLGSAGPVENELRRQRSIASVLVNANHVLQNVADYDALNLHYKFSDFFGNENELN